MDKISKSGKERVKMLMETSREDVRSVSGSNCRNIMLLVGKSSVADVRKEDVDKIGNFELDSCDSWKVGSIREIIQVKQGLMEVPGFDELEVILDYLCTF